eukprot:127006-Prymnesium_polylepis.1
MDNRPAISSSGHKGPSDAAHVLHGFEYDSDVALFARDPTADERAKYSAHLTSAVGDVASPRARAEGRGRGRGDWRGAAMSATTRAAGAGAAWQPAFSAAGGRVEGSAAGSSPPSLAPSGAAGVLRGGADGCSQPLRPPCRRRRSSSQLRR